MAAPVATPRTGTARRRWPRRLLVAALVLLLAAAGGVTAAWAYGRSLNGNLQRTDVFGALAPSMRPTTLVADAMNVLVLGSDSRAPSGTGGSARSDTMMLVHVDAGHDHGYVVSIPRDTWVEVPAAGGRRTAGMAKINAAYAWGGAPLAVQTVERFTGVRVDHVLVLDFGGFAQVVDALGGLDLTVDQTITSIFPPHRVYPRGRHHFTGAQALDYVRQRYQYADGDFTRERHQQEFLRALLNRAADSGMLADPVRLNDFLQSITRSITVDQGFDLVDTALSLRDLRSDDLTFLTSPYLGTGWAGGQSVVLPDPVRAGALYRAVGTDTVAAYLAAATP